MATSTALRDRQIADLVSDLTRARRDIDEDSSRMARHAIDMAIDFLAELRLRLHRDFDVAAHDAGRDDGSATMSSLRGARHGRT